MLIQAEVTGAGRQDFAVTRISQQPNGGEGSLPLDSATLSDSLKACRTADFTQYLTVSVPEPDAQRRSQTAQSLPQNSSCQSCLCLRLN